MSVKRVAARAQACLERAERLRPVSPREALVETRRGLRLVDVPPALAGRLHRLAGHVLRSLGRHAEAERAYQEAARDFTRAREPVEVARCAIGRIDALMYLGRHAELRRVAAAALRRFAAAGESAAAARLRNNLANLEYRLDRPEAALRLYAEARRGLARDPRARARIDANRANCLALRGRAVEASRLLRDARRTFERAGLALDVVACDYALAYMLFLGHRYAEALFALAALESSFERAGAADFRALLDLDAAEIYLRLGRPADALVAADRASGRSEALGLRTEAARALLFGAVARAARGEVAAARSGLTAAARAFRREGHATGAGIADLARAEIDLAAGRAAAAAQRARRAAGEFAREGDHEREGMAWVAAGRAELVRASRARAAGASAVARARVCARAAGSSFLAFRVACLEGDFAFGGGDLAAARRAYLRAARLSESTAARVRGEMVRATDWSAWEDAYPRLVAVEYAAGRTPALFRALERGRASAFERVAAALPRLSRGRDDAQARLERRLESIALRLEARGRGRASFAASAPPSDVVQEERRAVARELERLDRLGAPRARAAGVGFDLNATRCALPRGTLALEWFSTARGPAVLAIGKHGARTFAPRARDAEVTHWIEEMRYHARAGAAGDPSAARALGDVLAEARGRLLDDVLAWARADGGAVEALVVVPDGALAGLPWPALSPVPVAVLPTLAALRRPARSSHRRAVLLVGLGGDDLPEVQAEIEDLSRLVPAARVLMGTDATVARLRRAVVDVDWLHIAGHGHADVDRPILSGVRLADRWAHVPDFAPEGRAPRVVVLAACRTGELVGGFRNQWQGLPGGLLRAGAEAVLASLWEVADAPARAVSVALVRALREGAPLGEALRTARTAAQADPVHSWNAWTWGLFGRLDIRFPGIRPVRRASFRGAAQGDARGNRFPPVVKSSDSSRIEPEARS